MIIWKAPLHPPNAGELCCQRHALPTFKSSTTGNWRARFHGRIIIKLKSLIFWVSWLSSATPFIFRKCILHTLFQLVQTFCEEQRFLFPHIMTHHGTFLCFWRTCQSWSCTFWVNSGWCTSHPHAPCSLKIMVYIYKDQKHLMFLSWHNDNYIAILINMSCVQLVYL